MMKCFRVRKKKKEKKGRECCCCCKSQTETQQVDAKCIKSSALEIIVNNEINEIKSNIENNSESREKSQPSPRTTLLSSSSDDGEIEKEKNNHNSLSLQNSENPDGNFLTSCGTVPITDSDSDNSTNLKCYDWAKKKMANNNEKIEVDYEPELPNVAYMPVSKESAHYNMNHCRRGKALIFNFDKWHNTSIPDLSLSPRKGSKKDAKDLGETLDQLGFQVESHHNVDGDEFHMVLNKTVKENHSDSDCLLVAVMTHGERNSVYVNDGTLIPVNVIWEKFEAHKCPTLAGKPKIFIIQACRGDKFDDGTKLNKTKSKTIAEKPAEDVTDSVSFSYVIPNAADFIVAFSCPLGHYSWRHPEKGSWFIQSICSVFNQHAYKEDLQGLLTNVAREVALNYASNTTQWESNNKKQVTSTSSTLIRKVVFEPKDFKSIEHPHGVSSTQNLLIPAIVSISDSSENEDLNGNASFTTTFL